MAKKEKGINQELESAIAILLKEVMSGKVDEKGLPVYTITDKMKVLDRALKLEAIKLKLSDDSWGKGLFGEDEDEK